MNNALTSLALGKIDALREAYIQYDNNYLFEIDGTLVTLENLIECWRKAHDGSSDVKDKISPKQSVEAVPEKKTGRAGRKRSDNKNQANGKVGSTS